MDDIIDRIMAARPGDEPASEEDRLRVAELLRAVEGAGLMVMTVESIDAMRNRIIRNCAMELTRTEDRRVKNAPNKSERDKALKDREAVRALAKRLDPMIVAAPVATE